MTSRTSQDLAHLATPLRDAGDLDPLMERVGDARVVCIGEASHGTHEFYAWRADLTRRLVEEAGFDLVAVEGDWPDCFRVSRSVTAAADAHADPRDALAEFARWPRWMWANEEVADFVRWLRGVNLRRSEDRRVGFYGLDVYSLWESLRGVLDYLREHHAGDVASALEACRCFEPYAEDPFHYARATRLVPESCELEAVGMLSDLVRKRVDRLGTDSAAAFDAEQNARAVVGAEAYYRAVVRGGPDSWNVRDRHMAETLDRLLDHHGPASRAVVWEHNTHVGDARFTDMADAGMVNVGQLVRERYGEDACVLVGFGTHHGTVVAGAEWGLPMQEMSVPPARGGSIEDLLHEAVDDTALFVFGHGEDRALPDWAAIERPHRAIGVVYRPGAERWGNYVPTVLGRRYDAFCWIDETTGVRAIGREQAVYDELETWPTGV